MSTATLSAALKARFPHPAWAILWEVPDATGGPAGRSADALAMSLWPSRGLVLHGFELKVSRSDWIKELRSPAKAEAICGYCDHWWVVAGDKGIVRDGELPPTWGLIEAHGAKLKTVVEAPKLNPKPISRGFLASIFREVGRSITNEPAIQAAREAGIKIGRDNAAYEAKRAIEERQKLREKIAAFEEHSGQSIERNWDIPKLAIAVKLALRGDAERVKERMAALLKTSREISESIERILGRAEE